MVRRKGRRKGKKNRKLEGKRMEEADEAGRKQERIKVKEKGVGGKDMFKERQMCKECLKAKMKVKARKGKRDRNLGKTIVRDTL